MENQKELNNIINYLINVNISFTFTDNILRFSYAIWDVSVNLEYSTDIITCYNFIKQLDTIVEGF